MENSQNQGRSEENHLSWPPHPKVILGGVCLAIIVLILGFTGLRPSSSVDTAPVSFENNESDFLKQIYGNYDPINQTARWILSEQDKKDIESIGNAGMESAPLEVRVLATHSQGDRQYVITHASGEDRFAHVYGAIIGAHILEKENDGSWRTIYSKKAFDEMGSFGGLSDELVRVVDISKDQFVFEFRPGFTGHGYATAAIVWIAPLNDEFKIVFDYPHAYEDNLTSLDQGKYQRDTQIELFPARNQQFPDIWLLSTYIREINTTGGKSAEYNKHYAFDGEAYVRSVNAPKDWKDKEAFRLQESGRSIAVTISVPEDCQAVGGADAHGFQVSCPGRGLEHITFDGHYFAPESKQMPFSQLVVDFLATYLEPSGSPYGFYDNMYKREKPNLKISDVPPSKILGQDTALLIDETIPRSGIYFVDIRKYDPESDALLTASLMQMSYFASSDAGQDLLEEILKTVRITPAPPPDPFYVDFG